MKSLVKLKVLNLNFAFNNILIFNKDVKYHRFGINWIFHIAYDKFEIFTIKFKVIGVKVRFSYLKLQNFDIYMGVERLYNLKTLQLHFRYMIKFNFISYTHIQNLDCLPF